MVCHRYKYTLDILIAALAILISVFSALIKNFPEQNSVNLPLAYGTTAESDEYVPNRRDYDVCVGRE